MFGTTVLIAFAILGEPGLALDIGIATTVVKTASYYGYERLWDRVGSGTRGPETDGSPCDRPESRERGPATASE